MSAKLAQVLSGSKLTPSHRRCTTRDDSTLEAMKCHPSWQWDSHVAATNQRQYPGDVDYASCIVLVGTELHTSSSPARGT